MTVEDDKKEWNPLEEEVPEGVLKRVKVFARDLAWGAAQGIWDVEFNVSKSGDSKFWFLLGQITDKSRDLFSAYTHGKWADELPSDNLLSTMGYLQLTRDSDLSNNSIYQLTEKAFDLLDAPTEQPEIFVSYRRHESSSLAVLVETRLKLQDKQIGVFTDKDIPLGDDWAKRLEKSIVDCEYFICLLSHDTLSSEWVRKEIDWALESGSQIISICHSGYDLNTAPKNESAEEKQSRDKLLRWQYHLIREENAKEYHSAMTELVRNLGYSTL